MNSVRIVNKLEGLQATVNGHDVTLHRQGFTEIEVADWLALKNVWRDQIDGRYIYPESEEDERLAVSSFREALRARFSALGPPSVETEMDSGEFAHGVMKSEAAAWLRLQEHDRNSEVLAIAREANEWKGLPCPRRAASRWACG